MSEDQMLEKTYHSDNQSLALEKVNKLALVARLGTTEQARPQNRLDFLLMGERIELASSIALALEVLILAKDANMPANRLCSALVVARDADDADARGPAVRDRLAHFRARRVEHADERDEREVVLEARVVRSAVCLVVRWLEVGLLGVGERERAETLRAVRESLLEQR